MSYTYKPRTIREIRIDIEALKHDLDSLYDELDEAIAAEPRVGKVWQAINAPVGGLDLVKVAKAFGGIPKEWDE